MTLQVRALAHRYGTRPILSGIDLDVGAAETVCLAGESGCGKSTLLRLIAGLERPSEGTILRNGECLSSPTASLPPEQRRMGLVFQQAALFPHLSVLENVCFGMRPPSRAKALEWLEQVRFQGREEDYPHMLSGGQQQRVALARALAAEPEILLLDEPFASLDYALRKEIRADVQALLRARGIPTLLVTHDPQEALQMADRIILLNPQGRIEQIGTPRALYCHPRTDYAARFFGAANRLTLPGKGPQMVRPEQIMLSADGPETAHVRAVTFSGSHQWVELEWDAQIIFAKDYRHLPLQAGQSVRFHLPDA